MNECEHRAYYIRKSMGYLEKSGKREVQKTARTDCPICNTIKSMQKEIEKARQEGYTKALDDNNILHGEEAKKFLKDVGLEEMMK